MTEGITLVGVDDEVDFGEGHGSKIGGVDGVDGEGGDTRRAEGCGT
jgi:hypothetical protein